MRFPAAKVFVFSSVLVLGTGQVYSQASKPTASAKKQAGKGKTHRGRHRKPRKISWKQKGQQGMQPDRILAIQQALVREKYLTGEPTGKWDTETEAAMTRYQEDHGWQSKVTPDSRALIKLGLGPKYSEKELLKPISEPASGAVAPTSQTKQ